MSSTNTVPSLQTHRLSLPLSLSRTLRFLFSIFSLPTFSSSLSLSIFFSLPLSLSLYLSLSLSLSIYLSISLSLSLPISLSLSLSLSFSLCLSLSVYLCTSQPLHTTESRNKGCLSDVPNVSRFSPFSNVYLF